MMPAEYVRRMQAERVPLSFESAISSRWNCNRWNDEHPWLYKVTKHPVTLLN
jgi:hypothetical protein